MAEQTSRLAVIIDSSGAQKSAETLASALDNLSQEGKKAETATDNLSAATKDYNSWLRQGPKLADSATKSTQAATKATNDEAKALGALLDKINPINAALNRLDDQQQALSQFKSKGMLDEEAFTEYNARIEQAREKLAGFSEQLSKTGETSRHAAHNMAMIPSQLSWMITSIASGQSPIMALVQQGSMLSGMMGGMGPAIRGVGIYLAGLINPITVVTSAMVVYGLAFYQGQQEQEEFRKSLILTGNQVGKTADQLSDMATTISNVTGSTHGQAASVINQVVSAGNIAGDSLQKVSAAIVSISDATGQATDKLVSDFSNIANDPVAAITKLNDQYHFLTLATYNQVKALQDEGDQQDAAKAASDAYATALSSRAREIKQNLGYMERGWDSLGNAAKFAWDKMLNVGREDTLQQQISKLEAEISERSKPSLGSRFISADHNNNLNALKAQLSFLQSQATTQDVLNGFVDKHNQAQQAGIKAQEYIDNLQDQSLSNAERRTKEQNLLTEALKKTRAAGTSISAAEEAQLRQDIDNKYKDPATPKQRQGKAYTEDAGSRLVDQIDQQTAALSAQLNTTEKLSSVTQQRVKFDQQLAEIQRKVANSQPITADQQSLLNHQKEIKQAYDRQEALQKSVTTLDDYRKMMLEIEPKEQKQNDTLQKRLKILQGMVALKKLSPEDAARQAGEAISKNPLPDQVISAVNKSGGSLKSGATNSDLSSQGMSIMGMKANPEIETIQQLKKAQLAYAKWLDQQQKEIIKNTLLNEEQKRTQLNAIQKTGMQNQQMISTATYASELSAAQSSFSSITDSMNTMFGQQSTAYKAAFAVSKAFSIAQASLNMYTALSQVMADPSALTIYQKLADYATVAASMASITSGITSIAATGFQSGGYTGNGGVSDIAGVVHGQEFVMDAAATKRIGVSNLEAIRRNGLDATLSRSGFGTGAKNVSNSTATTNQTQHVTQQISINGNPSDATIQLVQQAAKQGAQQGYKMVAGDLAAGKGQVHKSLTAGYNTSRRTG